MCGHTHATCRSGRSRRKPRVISNLCVAVCFVASPWGVGERRPRCRLTYQLSQRSERGAQLFREERRFLPRGEVTALVDLVEVDGDVGVSPLDPAARGTPNLSGERRKADRDRDRRGRLTGCTNAFLCFFPVRARRR